MHDLVHDLAQSIMDNKVLGTQVKINNKSAPNTKVRQVKLEYLRTRVAFPLRILPKMDLTSAIMSYSRLRILNASSTNIDNLPSEIGKLKHLRCLNLSYTDIRSLPNAICSLWNLKILNLNGCFKLVCLPKNMRYMRNLRHLFLEGCNSLSEMPPSIGELASLQILSYFIVGHEETNQLKELEFLNLGGSLFIKHLERVKSFVDAKKVNLAKKQNLCVLSLQGEDVDEKVFEALQPHPNLKTLRVSGFKGINFPLWMKTSSLENIVEIQIKKCPSCLCLPQGLGELPHLKRLLLDELLAVQYIIEGDTGGVNSQTPKFLRLEDLSLHYLPNIKGLLKVEVVEMFPNLRTLSVHGCPSLILPKLSSLKSLETSGSSVTLTSFASLENLSIIGLSEHSLQEDDEGLRCLKSVTCLKIFNSTYFPKGWIPHLTALQELYIEFCPDFVEFPEEIKYLQALRYIVLYNLPKMICLPDSLQHLPLLQSLHLSYLPRLTLLPDWLGNLTSLNCLGISYCGNIASLPASIQGMENLKNLTIEECPELERRCEKEKGEDWHKITHISKLIIG